MIPVTRRTRDVAADVAGLYAAVGRTLCETPAHFFLDGVRAGGTIHKDEVWALERLLDPVRQGTSFVVGASFGFSSVVLAALQPQTRIVTIDDWSEGADVERAAAACTALAAMEDDPGPRLVFVTGQSPRDTSDVLRRHADGPLTVALIDGLHTNGQLVADYDGIEPWLDPATLLLLHDVRLFDLWAGVRHVAARNRFDTLVQLNTSTGLVLACNRRWHPAAFAFLEETQVVAHWRPDEAVAPGPTTSYPAIGWDVEADAREHRYDARPRPTIDWPLPGVRP